MNANKAEKHKRILTKWSNITDVFGWSSASTMSSTVVFVMVFSSPRPTTALDHDSKHTRMHDILS